MGAARLTHPHMRKLTSKPACVHDPSVEDGVLPSDISHVVDCVQG